MRCVAGCDRGSEGASPGRPPRSNCQDLLLLGLTDLVGGEDEAVGELLKLRFESLHLLGRHPGALFLRAELVVRMAAERPDLDTTVLELLVEKLHELTTPLLVQRGDVQADHR